MALAGDEVFVEVCRTINEIKEGLRPACLTQVRICEPGAPLQICGDKDGIFDGCCSGLGSSGCGRG
jgi:hypothetical protein